MTTDAHHTVTVAHGLAPGIYDLPAHVYHSDPCVEPSLSSSIAKLLCLASPAHARFAHPRLNPGAVEDECEPFDIGTAAHALLLEGNAGVAVLDFPDFRTNAARAARDAARTAGKTPLLKKTWSGVEAMVAAVRTQLAAHRDGGAEMFTHGKAEQTLIWREDDRTWCRARLDWLRPGHIDDFKSAGHSAHPDAWTRGPLFSLGFDIQAAFYLRGLKALTGEDATFRFAVIETTPPYALSVVGLGPAAMTLAEKKVLFALELAPVPRHRDVAGVSDADVLVRLADVGRNPVAHQGAHTMSFSYRPAVRENVPLLIGLSGASGAGKTYTAMLLSKGMAGEMPFAVIDTEAGRAKHYADVFRFDHGDLAPPFTPDRYADAIAAADAAKYPVVVVDSMSHEWAGDGGILDGQEAELERMAGTDWKKREACRMASWIKPKMAHKAMVQRLLQVRAHLILCFRAESKIEMVRGDDGRMEIREKQSLTGLHGWIPIAEKNLPYELTASFLLMPDKPGVPLPIKLQAQHRDLFPLNQPITEAAGAGLAAWARGGAPASVPIVDWPARIAEARTAAELKAIGKELKAASGAISAAALESHRSAYEVRMKSFAPRARAQ